MTLLLGALLAAGLVLAAAPWLWPAREEAPRAPRPGAVTRLLREAGFSADPRVLVVTVIGTGLVAGAAAWLSTGTAAFAAVVTVAAAAAPIVFLRSRRQRLLRLRRGLWPDVCDLLIASIRVGMPLPDAVAGLEEAAPTPLRPAFAAFSRDLHATGRFDAAAVNLKDALADPVGDRIVETLRMAREVGGTELSAVLRALSSSVRAEAALRAEVEARQSWIRGAAVLGAVAPWVILCLLLLRPEGAEAYTSPAGVALIVGGAAVSFVAFRIMLRIGRLPEPRRWFR
ncbi:type II secretion system F family protein [Microbacterium capsulatum]|uniref:Type II secretion system F family protein n=1 Tax=Microbacterium capsulatum TaxID=3041921 RepID=A0ABU0XG51_9MICO|nr:type II secretion system F family protein [Microbacterium sp. ASV81]MDQ4214106.1 type II secretion system F family protein [Microbacterium sp. ASV81]